MATTTSLANPDVQRALLGEAFDNADALIALADETGNYMAVNARACDVLGFTREEFLEKHVSDLAAEPGADERYRELFDRRRVDGEGDALSSDGDRLSFRYVTLETKVARMPMLIGIGRLLGERPAASR